MSGLTNGQGAGPVLKTRGDAEAFALEQRHAYANAAAAAGVQFEPPALSSRRQERSPASSVPLVGAELRSEAPDQNQSHASRPAQAALSSGAQQQFYTLPRHLAAAPGAQRPDAHSALSPLPPHSARSNSLPPVFEGAPLSDAGPPPPLLLQHPSAIPRRSVSPTSTVSTDVSLGAAGERDEEDEERERELEPEPELAATTGSVATVVHRPDDTWVCSYSYS